MTIMNLASVVEWAQTRTTKKMAVAAAEDRPVLEAVKTAMHQDIIYPILVGDKEKIIAIAKEIDFDLTDIEIVNESSPRISCQKAVALIRNGKAEILMKGLVGTADLLRAVLNKENGLRKGAIISHVALFETPHYHKLLAVTDAAMNVHPTCDEKVSILRNAVELFHKLGVEKPKVAVVGAVETVNEKMPATVHAAILTMRNRRKQITGCIVDGPFALDNAISKEACRHKGIESEVGGDADIIVCPDINAANVLYKSLNFLGGARSAAVIMGATVPIVLTSRADSNEAKHLSIALAAAME